MARSQNGPRQHRPSFRQVAAAALAAIDSVLQRWLPDGKREAQEYKARNPTRGDQRPGSFSVNLRSGKWADFATDARGGDLVALVAYLEGCNQGEAAGKLAEHLGMTGASGNPAPARTNSQPEAVAVFPVPSDAPPPPAAHPKHGKPSGVWVYRDRDGRELVRVCRFDRADGKEVLPLSFWRDASGLRWHWRALPEPRPLYGLDRLAERPAAPVLVTEGEKDADAAAALVPGFVVTTSPNGARSAAKADWEPLRGRRVVVWPDADAPGATYAADVARLALAAGARSVVVAKPEDLAALRPAGRASEPMPDGWGAADAAAAGIPADSLGAALDALQAPPAPKAAERPAKPPKPRPAAATAARAGFVEIKAGDHRGLRPGIYWQPVGVDRTNGEPVEGEPKFICSPLYVLAKTRDAAGSEWGRLLSWTDAEGKSHTWAMPAALLARGGDELREVLLAEGVEITPDPNLRRRLADYIMGADPQRFARCVTRTGWHGDVFVLPDRTIGNANGEALILQNGASDGVKLASAGTLEDWRRTIAEPCIGNSRLVFAVSVGFAATLLGLCDAEGGGIHLRGDSSAGKTTALVMAASIFGPPTFVRQWRATSNSLESVAALHSDLLLPLDEIGQLEPKYAAEVAYLLANGQGKSRARRDGSLRSPATWSLLFLSTGEVGLLDLMAETGARPRAGMEVRVVEVPADTPSGFGLFDHIPDHIAPGAANRNRSGAYSMLLKEAAAKNHGTALPAFLEALTADPASIRTYLGEFIPRFTNDLAGEDASGQVRRVARRFALIAAAGVLASHAGITGWATDEAQNAARRCFDDWLEARPAGRGESEPAAMLAQVRGFLEQHGEARFAPKNRIDDDRAPRTLQRCGWYNKTEAGIEYLVLPESFRNVVCSGFDHRSVAKLLIRLGALMPQSDSASATRKEYINGTGHRVYRITPKIWEAQL